MLTLKTLTHNLNNVVMFRTGNYGNGKLLINSMYSMYDKQTLRKLEKQIDR